jgi:hypothetical protein
MLENYFYNRCSLARFFQLLTFYLLSTVLALLTFMSVGAQGASVSSEVYRDNTKSKVQLPALKGMRYEKQAIPLNILLDSVTYTEKAQLRSAKNQPLKIGFGRDIPSYYSGDLQPLLIWNPLAGGAQVGTFSVTSPDAKALRLALRADRLPKGTEVRFFSFSLPEQMFGPFTPQDIMKGSFQEGHGNEKSPLRKTATGDDAIFWSPVIEGDTLGVEIYVPSVEAQYALSLKIVQVSHLAYSVLSPDEKNLSDIGRSGSCNIDVACQTIPANLEDAVAKIIFSEEGSSFLCTGSLLNDNEPNSAIPYFMTANHCLDTQEAARTVNSFWFFERIACNGVDPTSVTHQLTGGGDLLETGSISDYTLLLLKDPMPSGVTFAGWTDQPLAQNAPIIGIHHPAGDLKKWSQGSSTGFADYGGSVNGTGTHIRVVWTQGTTEGGSSGSGIFDAQGRFRGNLHGGSASCEIPNAPDYYGRFDITYRFVKGWLFDTPTLLTSGTDISDTVQGGEWKKYKVRVSASQELNVELFDLSQDADLYVRRGLPPTSESYNCRPFSAGTNSETCAVTNTEDGIYYISVQGFDSGSTAFTLQATLTGGGSGIDTVGLYRPQTGTFYLKDSNSRGVADVTFGFGPGNANWLPLVGDWDGS